MTIYPEGNPGVWPVDYATPVGNLRAIIGDTVAVEYDPPIPGFRSFDLFSDAELGAYLSISPDNPWRAAEMAFRALAANASLQASSIRDHDLAVDTRARGEQLLAIADSFADLADNADSGSEDAFLIVSTGTGGEFIPELSEPIWGRRYGWGRWA